MGRKVSATGWARCFPVGNGPRAARRWTLKHLADLGWTSRAPDTVDDVLLAVSELVTNAHVHAHSSAQLVLLRDRDCLYVSIHDHSPELPAPRPPDEDRAGGRGLAIVAVLADSWRAYPQADGKTICACFRPHG
ncbi:ATP-binding protein [Kitasatospora sp. MMS16-BH015]|uniref:ATP-binding protein n=1 Tax=Kitasatospora sp. MMS16-BH015 TaxID=2018025 RepID=UPI000CA27DBE|nr:ATP-binding protein [Kitasatospora sp. MMS16-BH015]AUG81499.1 ATP-binding protein [Kitasatospora sp. MMS16-BH015]